VNKRFVSDKVAILIFTSDDHEGFYRDKKNDYDVNAAVLDFSKETHLKRMSVT
jgi:hypothetical protein